MARRLRRRRPEADGDERPPRTFAWWSVLLVLAVVAAVGITGIVLGLADGGSETTQVDAPQTTTTLDEERFPPPGAAPTVTIADGRAAPDGVTEVTNTGDTASFAFAVPPALAASPVVGAVPPAKVVVAPGGDELELTVGCALSAGESLAQVSITFDVAALTVLPVVLAPTVGPPCDPAATPRSVRLPLAEPVGTRPVGVVPAGTAVPTPQPS